MLKIKALDHIALHVEDVEKTIHFYRDILELPVLPRPDFDFPGAWFQFGPSQELHIIGGRTGPVNANDRGNHYALAIDDIHEAEAFLKSKNYPYMPPRQRPDGIWQLYIQDPDGYFIELTQLGR